jgi:hypothetical protein
LITKKDLAVSILCTFCLTSALFSLGIVGSAEYDPWTDVTEDGRINVLDLIKVAGNLGTMGVNAKNVTIAGHTNKLAFTIQSRSVPAGLDYATPWILVDGYSKVTVCISTTSDLNSYRLDTANDGSVSVSFLVDSALNFPYYLVKTYDIPNREILITFENHAGTPKTVSIDVYLIP